MEFSFRYKVKPQNIWVLSMVNMYRSMVGVVNIVFTLSMILLALRFWPGSATFPRILMVSGILLFPLIQPFFIFLRSRKVVSRMPSDLEMTIDNTGIEVVAEESRSHVKFSDLKSVIRVRGMLILYTLSNQSYILNKEALEGQGEKLHDFLAQVVRSKKLPDQSA